MLYLIEITYINEIQLLVVQSATKSEGGVLDGEMAMMEDNNFSSTFRRWPTLKCR